MSNSVVIVANDLNYASGAQQYTLQVINTLAEKDWKVTVWTGTLAEGETCDAASVASTWHVHPDFFRRGRTWSEKNQRIREEHHFSRWVRENRPTQCLILMDWPRKIYGAVACWTRVWCFVHSIRLTCPQDEGNRYLPTSARICDARAGFRCLCTDRAEDCLGRRPPWRKWQRVWQTRSAMRAMAAIPHVVANSRYVAEVLEKNCPGVRPRILEPPVVVDGFPPLDDPHCRDPARRWRLLYAARLAASKGVLEALEILASLPAQYRLLVAGSGPDLEASKQRAESLQIADRVDFLGWLNRTALARLLPECGAVLMPGVVAEGFGMIGPEALSAGVPVVAYRAGGIMEWGNTQAVCAVPLADRRAFAAGIRSMTEDVVGWKSLCAVARSHAEVRFVPGSWARALLGMLCDDESPRLSTTR